MTFIEDSFEFKSGYLDIVNSSSSWVAFESGKEYRVVASTPVVYYDKDSQKYSLTEWRNYYETDYENGAYATVFFDDGDTVFILID